MGLFGKNSKSGYKKTDDETDVAVADAGVLELNRKSGFKMMERQEVFVPDLTSPVIEALISENIESGRSGKDHYSITDVMKLISVIPRVSDSELVMVIRTIASFGVDIKAVIKEAIEKERLAHHRVERLKKEIDGYKSKIKSGKEEIDLLQVGLVELVKSKDSLIKGMRLLKESGAVLPNPDTSSAELQVQEVLTQVTEKYRGGESETDPNKTRIMPKPEDKPAKGQKSKSKVKAKVKTKAKTSEKAPNKGKGHSKSGEIKQTKNTAETVELTSINLDVKPIPRK